MSNGGDRWLAVAASLALHAGVFALAWPSLPPRPAPPAPMQVTLLAPAPALPAAAPSFPGEDGDTAPDAAKATAAGHPGHSQPARTAGPLPATVEPMAARRPQDTAPLHGAPDPSTEGPARDTGAAPSTPAEAAPSITAYSSGQVMAALKQAFSAHFYYPMLARRQGWEGDVTLALRVEIDGRLTGIHVVGSSGHRALDNAAVDSLTRARALPLPGGALDGGLDMVLPVRYRLLDTRV
ncbi:MAG: energy transducer TonB [Gammaproteobacteria bacterium]|nr:energy transducer TonB [Gammaproteobacteria bacterium]